MIERTKKTPIEVIYWHADVLLKLATNDLFGKGIEITNESLRRYIEEGLRNSFYFDSLDQKARRFKTRQINRIVDSLASSGESIRKREHIAQEQISKEYVDNDKAFKIIGDIITKKRYVEKS